MIKLVDLLLENDQKPKAIFLAGPAGSGKSTFVRNFLQNKGLKSINLDDAYEDLLRKAGLDKPQSEFDAEELSQSAKLMGQAQKINRQNFEDSSQKGENIIIDGTGAAANPIKKKKQQLEDLGYDTFMAMIYVSPLTSLDRNKKRGDEGGRSLRPSIILRTWDGVVNNIDTYRDLFGDNMVVLNNEPVDSAKDYDEEAINKFFSSVKYSGKPKSPEEEQKAEKEQRDQKNRIKQVLSNPPKFDEPNEITNKINAFLK